MPAPADMIMLGWPGSTAELYAGENNIIFRSLQNPEFFQPDSLRTIGVEAFAGINAKGVVIPKTVIWIEGNPFVDSMTKVIYGDPGSEAKVFADKFSYCFVAIDDAWMEKHRK